MEKDASSSMKILNVLDWTVSGAALIIAATFYLIGLEGWAVFLGIGGAVGLALAWINPGKVVLRIIERKMFNKRPR